MAASKPQLVPVSGSELPSHFAAKAVGRANAIELITVTVKVRAKDDKGSAAGLEALATRAVGQRSHVSREDFAAAHGADPADLKKVEDYARASNLSVIESCAARRRVVLAGKVSDFESAFGVTLERFEHPGGTFRSHTSPVHVPPDLEPIVEAVLGLSSRPAAKPHFQAKRRANPLAGIFTPADSPQPLTPLQVAQLYDFPTGLDGSGQCIAIIELGGGFTMADLNGLLHEPRAADADGLGRLGPGRRPTPPATTPTAPTARSCSTSRWPAPSPPRRRSSSTSRRTRRRGSSRRSPTRRTTR